MEDPHSTRAVLAAAGAAQAISNIPRRSQLILRLDKGHAQKLRHAENDKTPIISCAVEISLRVRTLSPGRRKDRFLARFFAIDRREAP